MSTPQAQGTCKWARPNYWKGYPLPGFSGMVSASVDERFTLVVTSSAKVPSCMKMLRSEVSPALVGEIREDEWMLHVIDFVVGSPDSVLGAFNQGKVTYSFIGAVVIDDAASEEKNIDELLETLALLLPKDALTFPAPVHKSSRWICSPRERDVQRDGGQWSPALRSLLQQHFPEVVTCPGLGDSYFRMAGYLFANGSDLVQHDWSGLVNYMPGILRGMRAGSRCHALILTLNHRAAQVARLVQAFVDYMGLSQCRVCSLDADVPPGATTRTNIVVGAPDRLYRELVNSSSFTGAQQVILVEADRLLESQKEQVDYILELLGQEVQLGVHSETMTSLVEEVVGSETERIPKAGCSLKDVQHFYATAVENDRFDVLCQICDRLLRSKAEPVVVCHNLETVAQVKKQLLTCGAGYLVHDSVDCLGRAANKRGIVVTDAHGSQGAADVITLDIKLSSSQVYFEICKMPRDQPRKMVIHLLTQVEAVAKIKEVARLYGVDIKPYE